MLRRIVHNSSAYLLGITLSLPLIIASLLITLSLLGPKGFGELSLIILFVIYANYFDWGISQGILREIPHTRQAKDRFNLFAAAVTATVKLYGMLALVVMLIISVFGFFPQLQVALLLGCGLIVVQQLWLLGKFYLKATNKMQHLAIAIVVFSIVLVPASYLCIKNSGISGAILALIVSMGCGIGYMNHAGVPYALTKKYGKVHHLVNKGLGPMLVAFVALLLLTVDKFIVSMFMGTEVLGALMIGFIVMKFLLYLPRGIGYIMRKHMHMDPRSSAQSFVQTTRLFSYIAPLLIGVIILIVPALIMQIDTHFQSALLPFQAVVLSTFFLSLAMIGNEYLKALQETHLITMKLFSIGTLVILDLVAIHLGFGIDAIAAITLIVYLIYAKKVTLLCTPRAGITNPALFILREYVPFFFMVALCVLLQMIPIVSDPLSEAILNTVLFIIAYLLFFLHMDKRLELLPNSLINGTKNRNN